MFNKIVNIGKYVQQSMRGTFPTEMKAAFNWRLGKLSRPAKFRQSLNYQKLIPDGIEAGQ